MNRDGLSRCERENREIERRSSGSGDGKHNACGVVDGGVGKMSGGMNAARSQTKSEAMGTIV
jgi:hypothetical protein